EAATAESLQHDVQHPMVIVQLDPFQKDERLGLIREIASQHSATSVVAVAEHADSATILAAMRAGAIDFLLVGQDDDRVHELLGNVLKRKVERKPQQSNVIAVLSGHSDSGMAFLAQHLVLAMGERQRRNESVLLLDLANPPGAAAVFMNVQNEYSALDAIADAYRCDTTLVETAFGQHAKGAYVLSLPETQVGAAQLDINQLRAFLDVAASLFDQIVICADRSLGEAVLNGIAEYAHHSLVTCDQSILSSRHNQQMLRSMRAAGISLEHAGLVVDRYQKRIGLEPEKLADLLQLPLLSVLAGDPCIRMKAMNAGESLFETAANDEYLRGLRRVVDLMLGRASAEPQRRGFFDKLLS
ncbi:MAG: AAA family ATPase, partial [Nevskiales bacterium]